MMLSDSELIRNMLTEIRRGTLTIAVLSQLKTPQYGYSLLQSLESQNVKIEANTLYPLLRRLEMQGLLQSDWDTTESRPRKYYILNREGTEVYLRLKQEWKQINEEMLALFHKEELL